MAVRLQSSAAKRRCQLRDNRTREQDHKNMPTDEVYGHWELTEQQQAFIALFTEEDHKKH
ncbi:hypothetical protein [Franconibacter pulveris]|uniref:hypothetical protein n=1 Tax=Franconibacter pulveris TaxID=435910 RepID=UPI00128EF84C|nr:hypothetical protein [Franconibacter pulveris]